MIFSYNNSGFNNQNICVYCAAQLNSNMGQNLNLSNKFWNGNICAQCLANQNLFLSGNSLNTYSQYANRQNSVVGNSLCQECQKLGSGNVSSQHSSKQNWMGKNKKLFVQTSLKGNNVLVQSTQKKSNLRKVPSICPDCKMNSKSFSQYNSKSFSQYNYNKGKIIKDSLCSECCGMTDKYF